MEKYLILINALLVKKNRKWTKWFISFDHHGWDIVHYGDKVMPNDAHDFKEQNQWNPDSWK